MHKCTDIDGEALAVFGDVRLASVWLERPSPLYGGQTPRQAIANPEHLKRAKRQLGWMTGQRQGPELGSLLDDVLNDPMVNLVLARAGSGPEQLLAMCEAARARKRAA